MRRREFITLLGGTVGTWPLAARAQQADKIARIGFLGAASASGYARQIEGFRLGLHDLGYIEGTNIVIAYRWAEGNYGRLPELADHQPLTVCPRRKSSLFVDARDQ
jgi:putative tryptophan/tyrosine transport system substrate-binding protein